MEVNSGGQVMFCFFAPAHAAPVGSRRQPRPHRKRRSHSADTRAAQPHYCQYSQVAGGAMPR